MKNRKNIASDIQFPQRSKFHFTLPFPRNEEANVIKRIREKVNKEFIMADQA